MGDITPDEQIVIDTELSEFDVYLTKASAGRSKCRSRSAHTRATAYPGQAGLRYRQTPCLRRFRRSHQCCADPLVRQSARRVALSTRGRTRTGERQAVGEKAWH